MLTRPAHVGQAGTQLRRMAWLRGLCHRRQAHALEGVRRCAAGGILQMCNCQTACAQVTIGACDCKLRHWPLTAEAAQGATEACWRALCLPCCRLCAPLH